MRGWKTAVLAGVFGAASTLPSASLPRFSDHYAQNGAVKIWLNARPVRVAEQR